MEPRTIDAHPSHPTLRAYAEQLPNGWHSHPECEARTTLLRGLARLDAFRDPAIVPGDLLECAGLLERTDWLPEVVHTAMLLAVRDGRFPGARGEDEFLAWMVQINRDVMPNVSAERPEVAARIVTDVWNGLHRGTPLWVVEQAPQRSVLFMAHPPGIFPPLVQRWRRHVLASFLATAGAVQPRVRDVATESGTRIEADWR